jgi:hypothetical protein
MQFTALAPGAKIIFSILWERSPSWEVPLHIPCRGIGDHHVGPLLVEGWLRDKFYDYRYRRHNGLTLHRFRSQCPDEPKLNKAKSLRVIPNQRPAMIANVKCLGSSISNHGKANCNFSTRAWSAAVILGMASAAFAGHAFPGFALAHFVLEALSSHQVRDCRYFEARSRGQAGEAIEKLMELGPRRRA